MQQLWPSCEEAINFDELIMCLALYSLYVVHNT